MTHINLSSADNFSQSQEDLKVDLKRADGESEGYVSLEKIGSTRLTYGSSKCFRTDGCMIPKEPMT